MWGSSFSYSLFMTQAVCLCHLLAVKPWTISSIFLSFDQSLRLPPLSILRMFLRIFQGRISSCLFLRWNFCRKAWFPEVFWFFCGTLFSFSFFHACLMIFAFNNPCTCRFQSHKAFKRFSHLAVLFLWTFNFSLLAWHIFQCRIQILYLWLYIQIFQFFRIAWCRPCT